jgi:hypothetical protein
VRKSAVHRASVSLLIVLIVPESGTDVKKTGTNPDNSNTTTPERSLRDYLVHGVVPANTDCTHAVRCNTYFSIVSSTDYPCDKRSIVTVKFLLQL